LDIHSGGFVPVPRDHGRGLATVRGRHAGVAIGCRFGNLTIDPGPADVVARCKRPVLETPKPEMPAPKMPALETS
jgi:hypothetical protein